MTVEMAANSDSRDQVEYWAELYSSLVDRSNIELRETVARNVAYLRAIARCIHIDRLGNPCSACVTEETRALEVIKDMTDRTITFRASTAQAKALLRFLRRIDPEAPKRLLDREEVEACEIAGELLRMALRHAIELGKGHEQNKTALRHHWGPLDSGFAAADISPADRDRGAS